MAGSLQMVYEIIPIQLCNSVIPESYRLYQTTNHGGHTKNTAQLRTKSSFPTSSPLQPSDTSHEILAWLFLYGFLEWDIIKPHNKG